jgi:RimJ/RimL family protein N-acetyltransferase
MSSTTKLEIRPLTREAMELIWDEVGDDPETWQWIGGPAPIPRTKPEFLRTISDTVESMACEYFSFTDLSSGKVVAISAFLDIRPKDRHLEIGGTFIARKFRGGSTNSRMKLIMLTEAFEHRDCVRVTFKVNSQNQRSREAVLRLGAKFEGELRNQREQRDGSWRTAAIYSIIDTEWPAIKMSLEEKLKG